MAEIFRTPDYIHQPLYVVTPIFNPIRFKSRWKHYQRFAAHVKASGGVLVTVEASFGERHHALDVGMTQYGTEIYPIAPTKDTEFHKARSTNPHIYHKVQTSSELWVKENLINIGIGRLPHDWKYVAWIDADVMFARPNWVGETIHQLQHYKVVQMFSQAQDLNSDYNYIQPHRSFADCYLKGVPKSTRHGAGYYYGGKPRKGPVLWHPGFAWAARRDAIDELGGLIDFAILGSADNHMAHALIGCVEESVHAKIHPRYLERLKEWQWRAEKHIRRNVGCVDGLLLHNWHGPKVDRKYKDRWRILVDGKFNPDMDIKYDWQGLLQLQDRGIPRSIKLRDDIMTYFRGRNEDALS